ncbi:MAG: hypothetical protein OEU26_21730, partial [Candidatus Tectomicrobia bacterium]|nr:hypothetical protein [Candidatus Tectomicrobia bacterium]
AALHQQQCERARRRIEEMKHIHERSGTLVRHVQGVVHRAIHAHASYYCVIDGANICVEYYQRHTWNRPVFPNFHNSAQTVVTFRTLCERENYFQWVDIKEGRGLSSILFEYGQFGKGESEYLIGVIKDNNNPIAILIFQFYQGKIIIHEVYKEIILFAVSALYLPSRYLYQRRTKKLIIEPIFRGRETRVEQDMAFVLMPFSAEWSDRIWESFLKPILISEDFKPIRADNLFGPDIMEDIWAGILQARIVIGDITGRNANVFYELGMAHTLGKDVILLTQNINDIPFDLNRYRHIIYQDNHDGYNVLTEKLKAALQEIKRA